LDAHEGRRLVLVNAALGVRIKESGIISDDELEKWRPIIVDVAVSTSAARYGRSLYRQTGEVEVEGGLSLLAERARGRGCGVVGVHEVLVESISARMRKWGRADEEGGQGLKDALVRVVNDRE